MNNIKLIPSDKCTGCGACYSKCSVDAIEMRYDSEGFISPVVNEDACIDCGMCLKWCPVEKPLPQAKEPETWAVMADVETRLASSSGGDVLSAREYHSRARRRRVRCKIFRGL